VINQLANFPRVIVEAGFSGHGFKFVSGVGEILSVMMTKGSTRHDISKVALDRSNLFYVKQDIQRVIS
jgi:N-methyl-L-tryptophan oxidase